jgi:RNA recognition motif-containing protein
LVEVPVQNEAGDKTVTTIYVGNIDAEISEPELHTLFGHHGTVHEIAIPRNGSGGCRGFAFVYMPDEGSADRAVSGLNGISYRDRPLIVDKVISP